MKISGTRIIILFLVWILTMADLLLGAPQESPNTALPAEPSDDIRIYQEYGLIRVSRNDLPDSEDLLRGALMDLFEGIDGVDTDTIPLFVDDESQLWVLHNHEFHALMHGMDNVQIKDHGEKDWDTAPKSFLWEADESEVEIGEDSTMAQAVNRIVGKLFNVRLRQESMNECLECEDSAVTDDSLLPPVSDLQPSQIEKLERNVLLDFFKQAWSGTAIQVDESIETCQLRGVHCETRINEQFDPSDQDSGEPPVYRIVTRLELTNAQLHTTLPASFANLRHLSVLNLAGNRLHGSIPEEYKNMSYSLFYLDFGENNLIGTVPPDFLSTSTGLQEVRLNQNSLEGPLFSCSGQCEALKVIDLSDNFFTGSIPSDIAIANNLQYLIIGNNFITGTLPSQLTQLKLLYTLDAGSNFIDDTMDHVMQVLPLRLLDVNLNDNFIHGEFSKYIFEQEQLELVLLSRNLLEGSLPGGMGEEEPGWLRLSNLKALHVSDNLMTGTLPPSMFTELRSSLSSLQLGRNRFSGTIPSEIGELESLFIIDAMSNQLRGTLPIEMLQLNRNLRFNFTDNLLTGTIPDLFCGKGVSATSMLYQENGCDAVLCRPGTFNIHGHATLHTSCRACPPTDEGEALDPPISKILGRTQCEGLEYVHGDLNGDGMVSPREVLRMLYIDTLGRFWGPNFQNWANMTIEECDLEGVTCVKGRITKLDLTNANMCSDGNRKPGPISYCKGVPAEIGEIKSLEELQLSRRQFLRGSIPTEIGRLSNLRLLDVSSCVWLTGTLPTELGQLTNLKVLKIVNTKVRGTIPSELFSLTSLELLHLTNNHLIGTIPLAHLPNVKELMLARNALTGTLPTEIGDMRKLENFEAYHNELTGKLPNEFGSCSLLKRIDVFNNHFTGTIPATLLSMNALQILHLKGNKLSGTIPELGKLPRMSWIDLSNNKLHGTVPQSLASSLVLEDLRLGGNRLYDPIPRGLCSNPNVNGGATKQYGCAGILCPLGTYAETSGHASETYGPCVKCPTGQTTMYLGSSLSDCREISLEETLTMFFEVMQGDVWPDDAQRNWGDMNVNICEWAGISCDVNGELVGMAFPLVGLDDY